MQSTHATLNTSHILSRCHVRRSHDVAIRACEVCVPAGGEWQGSRLELFAMYRKRAGRSGISCCVSGADVDGRHDIQHEITRCAKTPRNMTVRTASIMQVRATVSHAQHLETDRSLSGTGKTLAQCDTYGLCSCVIVRRNMRAARCVPVLVPCEKATRQTTPSPRYPSPKTTLVMEAPLHWRKV